MTEEQEDAAALLATVRHLMSGREEAICERIASGECSENPTFEVANDDIHYSDPESFAGYPTADEQPLFDALRNQFPREIAGWKNGGGA